MSACSTGSGYIRTYCASPVGLNEYPPVGIQLDPVHAPGRRARERRRAPSSADRIICARRADSREPLRRLRLPGDAAAGDLEARPVEVAHVDRVADLDVAVAVAVRAHVARGGEAGLQVGLQVLNGDRASIARVVMPAGRVVVHVRVRVDESGQHGGLAEIDHRHAGGNPDLTLGTDIRDAFAGTITTCFVSI